MDGKAEIEKMMIDLVSRIEDKLHWAARPDEIVLDNSQLAEKLNISIRTLATWRDKRYVTFSKIDGKIYYRWSDVLALMEKKLVKSRPR